MTPKCPADPDVCQTLDKNSHPNATLCTVLQSVFIIGQRPNQTCRIDREDGPQARSYAI
jgi:hypothetical protein